MAKEEKKPSKRSEKAQKVVHEGHADIIAEAQKQIRNHDSRPDNIVKKE
jgi:hypothetical protein